MSRTRTPGRAKIEKPRIPETATVTDAALGAAIRARRLELGLHQDALAERSGIDRAVISRVERGERACRFTEFVVIAWALNMGANELFARVMGDAEAVA